MIYYKLKGNKNIEIYGKKENSNYMEQISIFIKNELLTKKELEKIIKKYNFLNYKTEDGNFISKVYMDKNDFIKELFNIKEINKNKTYLFFGARKEVEDI